MAFVAAGVTPPWPKRGDDPRRVAAVVFDFGGVVQPKGPVSKQSVIAQALQLEPQLIAPTLQAALKPLKCGQGDEAHIWQVVAHRFGRVLPADWAERYAASVCRQPLCQQTLAIAARLRRLGYVVALCANTTPWRARANEARGAYAAFWPRVLSCEAGVAKPSPDIFKQLISALALAPSQVLFVDDKPANVAAAKAMGLQAVPFTGAKALQSALDTIL